MTASGAFTGNRGSKQRVRHLSVRQHQGEALFARGAIATKHWVGVVTDADIDGQRIGGEADHLLGGRQREMCLRRQTDQAAEFEILANVQLVLRYGLHRSLLFGLNSAQSRRVGGVRFSPSDSVRS